MSEENGTVTSALRLAIRKLKSESHITLAKGLADKLAEYNPSEQKEMLSLLITEMVNDLDIIDGSEEDEE